MEKKEHPSYRIIRIARSSVSGRGTALFGSSIMHNNVIRLTITQGVMERDANEDRFFPKERMKDRLIELGSGADGAEPGRAWVYGGPFRAGL